MANPEKITPRIEAQLSPGVWTNISADVISDVKASWGVHGWTPTDRLAEVGTLSFDLDNSTQNLGAARGYWVPGSATACSGWAIGTQVRLVLNHALYGDKVKWWGTLDNAEPVSGVSDPRVKVSCVDWMSHASSAKPLGIPVQTNIQSDALFAVLVSAVPTAPPGGTRSGAGSDIYAYALDDAQDEGTAVSELMNRLALSEFGYIFVDAGVAVFQGRRVRAGAGAVRFALSVDDYITALKTSHQRDQTILNRIQVQVHPRRIDTVNTSILYSLPNSAVQIIAGTVLAQNCEYRDPNQQAQRVGGTNFIAPVASTDYLFNTAQDGSGLDITSQITITPVDGTGSSISWSAVGGNAASLQIKNNGPLDGYLIKLQVRGQGLYNFQPVLQDINDAASVAAYGQLPFSYDMLYQSSPANGLDTAAYILALNKLERTIAESVSYVANWDLTAVENAFNLAIGDKVSITAAESGQNATAYFVNGISLEVRMNGVVVVTYDLCAANTTQFWILDDPVRSILDSTTILGYGLFVPSWILGTSVLGTDTFLG